MFPESRLCQKPEGPLLWLSLAQMQPVAPAAVSRDAYHSAGSKGFTDHPTGCPWTAVGRKEWRKQNRRVESGFPIGYDCYYLFIHVFFIKEECRPNEQRAQRAPSGWSWGNGAQTTRAGSGGPSPELGSLRGKCSSAACKALSRLCGCLSALSTSVAVSVRAGAPPPPPKRVQPAAPDRSPIPSVHTLTTFSLVPPCKNSAPILYVGATWASTGTTHNQPQFQRTAQIKFSTIKFRFQFKAVLSHRIILLQLDFNFEALSGKPFQNKQRTSS